MILNVNGMCNRKYIKISRQDNISLRSACWVNISADGILKNFIIFPQNRLKLFLQIVSVGVICTKSQSIFLESN